MFKEIKTYKTQYGKVKNANRLAGCRIGLMRSGNFEIIDEDDNIINFTDNYRTMILRSYDGIVARLELKYNEEDWSRIAYFEEQRDMAQKQYELEQ